MLKLLYEHLSIRGWQAHEDLFLPREKRTAVEIAREKGADKDHRNVRVLSVDLDKGEVRRVVWEVEDGDFLVAEAAPIQGRVAVFDFLNLGKLPAKPKPHVYRPKAKTLLGVKVVGLDAFDLPKPKARVSKRQRQFGAVAVK